METGRLSALGPTARIGVVAVIGLAASGCGAREFLDSGRHNGELFLGTFMALAIVAFLIAFVRRRRQLERWDLRVEPTAPLALAAVHPLFWIGGAAFLLFLVVDLTLVQHGGQRALNLLLFTAAAVIGGFLGGFLGVRLAERRWR
jgi:hypothetical protein